MRIKDFTPGQTVYALRQEKGKTTEYFLKRYKVTSVGRKYVKAAPEGGEYAVGRFTTEFYDPDGGTRNYLVENKDWGNRMRLFLTEEAANEEIEADMLKPQIRRMIESYRLNDYTVEQLRAVKKILEE